ncbi:endoglucanase 3 [Hordeum vulgare]|nr:endoglucanase 3 [Hordeum vulgare]
MANLANLEGDGCMLQEQRVRELIDTTNTLQAQFEPVQAGSMSPHVPVHEVHAIKYFSKGCHDDTPLKHKLMCSKPASLADLMIKADKYNTADSAMRVKVNATGKAMPARPAVEKSANDNRPRQYNDPNGKRKQDQPDPRYNNRLVATTKEQ